MAIVLFVLFGFFILLAASLGMVIGQKVGDQISHDRSRMMSAGLSGCGRISAYMALAGSAWFLIVYLDGGGGASLPVLLLWLLLVPVYSAIIWGPIYIASIWFTLRESKWS